MDGLRPSNALAAEFKENSIRQNEAQANKEQEASQTGRTAQHGRKESLLVKRTRPQMGIRISDTMQPMNKQGTITRVSQPHTGQTAMANLR